MSLTIEKTTRTARTLRPYPNLKDSGVNWLGAVPRHWRVQQMGRIGRLWKGRGGNKGDESHSGTPCIRYGDLYTTHEFFILRSRSYVSDARATEYTPVETGDLLFAASGETIDEIGKSAVNLIQSPAFCGADIILFRPDGQFDARYLGYLADCKPVSAQKARMGRGITVKHIYTDRLKNLTLVIPPLKEQHAIAQFLDQVNRRIHRYTRAKQTLIELLGEQKQAIIQQAVTGQIDVRTGNFIFGLQQLSS